MLTLDEVSGDLGVDHYLKFTTELYLSTPIRRGCGGCKLRDSQEWEDLAGRLLKSPPPHAQLFASSLHPICKWLVEHQWVFSLPPERAQTIFQQLSL